VDHALHFIPQSAIGNPKAVAPDQPNLELAKEGAP
jgi:hypothetical protein